MSRDIDRRARVATGASAPFMPIEVERIREGPGAGYARVEVVDRHIAAFLIVRPHRLERMEHALDEPERALGGRGAAVGRRHPTDNTAQGTRG